MSIAQKLTTIAENQQRVYDTGFAAGQMQGGYDEGYEQGKIDGNVLAYATRLTSMFQNAVFPDGYEIVIDSQNAINNISSLFYGATGVRKISMAIPTGLDYNANSFLYQNTTVEEVVLPDGIHFTNWNYFATNVKTLKSVFGRIDARGTASNMNVFNGCTALVDVAFMPSTIESAFAIARSADLSDASIQSIIDGLADLTGQTAQTLTLHNTVGNKLTDAQKATITAKNWTLVY